jgi:cytochrome c peroxidase
MKNLTLLTLSLFATTSLIASSLIDDAKNSGLVALPESQSALLTLIDNPRNPITPQKVALGKQLFFEPRLSKSGFISCNSCHNLGLGGVDGLAAAVGHKWTVNPHHLNSPTVYNAVFMQRQFWDGRDPDLEKQAQGPIQAGPEMAATKEHVVNTVKSIPKYVDAFKKAYGDGVKITFEKVTDAIATFERTLVTPSKYDAFLNGHTNALSSAEKKGMKVFIDKGCTSCHNGIALGGSMQAFGVTGEYKYKDVGDFRGNSNGLVKVPTLRNITQTAPYFHNGAVSTLDEAINEMGRIQLGLQLSRDEVTSIRIFLNTLTGDKGDIHYPQLPTSSPSTPKADLK